MKSSEQSQCSFDFCAMAFILPGAKSETRDQEIPEAAEREFGGWPGCLWWADICFLRPQAWSGLDPTHRHAQRIGGCTGQARPNRPARLRCPEGKSSLVAHIYLPSSLTAPPPWGEGGMSLHSLALRDPGCAGQAHSDLGVWWVGCPGATPRRTSGWGLGPEFEAQPRASARVFSAEKQAAFFPGLPEVHSTAEHTPRLHSGLPILGWNLTQGRSLYWASQHLLTSGTRHSWLASSTCQTNDRSHSSGMLPVCIGLPSSR